MTAIRSLADELREKMRQGIPDETQPPSVDPPAKKTGRKAGKPPPEAGNLVETLLADIAAFELTGNEKLLIRLDNRTVFLMKQLKIARGIDMNKLIAYSVAIFFNAHPELIAFVKSTLQTIEL